MPCSSILDYSLSKKLAKKKKRLLTKFVKVARLEDAITAAIIQTERIVADIETRMAWVIFIRHHISPVELEWHPEFDTGSKKGQEEVLQFLSPLTQQLSLVRNDDRSQDFDFRAAYLHVVDGSHTLDYFQNQPYQLYPFCLELGSQTDTKSSEEDSGSDET